MTYKDKDKQDAYYKEYRETHRKHKNEYMKIYRKEHLEEHRKNNRIYGEKNKKRLRDRKYYRDFGISLETYDALFLKQEGRCSICGKTQSESKKLFSVDHDHKTGKIRGLLCNKCNLGIGLLNDDTELLMSAIKYLEENITDEKNSN